MTQKDDGFDFDGGVSNSTIQYCYAANNDGFGFLFAQYVGSPTDNYNNTYRYCIGENNGLDHGGSHNFSEVGYWSGDKKLRDNVVTHCAFKSVNPFVLAFTTGTGTIENNQIDNCIFYQDNSYSPWYALLDNVYPSDLHFLNNFYGKPASASNTDYFWVNGSTLTSLPAFRAAGQETLSGTSYGLSGDPLFQSGSEEDGFKLHAGSPARNASVSFPPAVPGSIDYFRNSAPVGTRDIGAHEVQ